MKINQNSLSFKLLKLMSSEVYKDLVHGSSTVTSCQYRWAVFTSLMAAVFFSCVFTCLAFFLLVLLIFVVGCNIQYIGNLFGADIHWIKNANTGTVTLGTWCLIGYVIHLVMAEKRKIQKWIDSRLKPEVPEEKGAIAQWYDEIKNKYCSVVELESKENK